MPIFSGPASTLKLLELAGVVQRLDRRVEGGGDAVVDFDVARASSCDGKMIEPLVEALVEHALGQRLAADRRRRGAPGRCG